LIGVFTIDYKPI